jgi:glycine/D-amino acid oxidase-like deaminating enzyme
MADPAAYGGSFYAAGMPASPERGLLAAESDVDVCVVGGGLAGLTAARELARRGWSVTLLEAQRIAWNASSRNLGFVLPGFAADPESIVERVGADHARALWDCSVAGAEYVRRAIRECRMTGVEYGAGGWLHVSKTDNDGEFEAHADMLSRQFRADVEFWPRQRVRKTLDSPLYFSGVNYRRAFTINPLNYALGLAAAAEAAGARIYEMTPALEIDPQGVRKRITTPTARLRARHVVLAGNVQVGRLMPKLARTFIPLWPYVIVTAPLGDRLGQAIGYRGGISDTERGNNHYRVVGGDRLLWSGHSTAWPGNPRRRIKALTTGIRRAYPQLGEVEAEFAWSGALGNTVHRMPQIGELSPGLWLTSGFGGHGLNTTAMAGELVARAIVENDDTWRLFEPFELIGAGGFAGRAAAQLYSWGYARSERIENARALRRAARQPPAPPPPLVEVAPEPVVEAVTPEPDPPQAPPQRRRVRKPRRKKANAPPALEPEQSGAAAANPPDQPAENPVSAPRDGS